MNKVFKFVHETVIFLSKGGFYIPAMYLFLQCSLAANKCGSDFETISYEFLTQALVIYEEHVTDSQTQFHCITVIIGTLQKMHVFGEENYDTLVTKVAQYSSKLLKKPDQCRAIYMCSHLFWRVGIQEVTKKKYKYSFTILSANFSF